MCFYFAIKRNHISVELKNMKNNTSLDIDKVDREKLQNKRKWE